MLVLPEALCVTSIRSSTRIRPPIGQAINLQERHAQVMLTEIYIEALLVDEELANQVWELWNAGLISDSLAKWAW